MRVLLLLWLVAFSTGCAQFLDRGPGDEQLFLTNQSGEAVSVILRIVTADGGIPVFSQEVFLERGQSKEFAVVFAPGVYLSSVTTTNGLSERFAIEIPERGDARIELSIFNGRASMTVTQR
jgi:hypothetical protein